MDYQEALTIVNQAISSKIGRLLRDVEIMVFRGSWLGLTYDQMAKDSPYESNYLKGDVGHKLWKMLSCALGEEVSKRNFKAAVERAGLQFLEQREDKEKPSLISETVSNSKEDNFNQDNSKQDWDRTMDVSVFYGRSKELTQLEEWILKKNCRIVALIGMAGIGKTSLSVKLAEKIHHNFEYLIWRSLDYAPSLHKLIEDLVFFLSDGEQKEIPDVDEEAILVLMNYLRKHRCLLVLDDWENILPEWNLDPEYGEKYQSYGNLIKQIGEQRHQSCLILNSREKPHEINLVEGKYVYSLQIEGLGKAAKEILKDKDLLNPEDWEELIRIYRGNPLALKLIATRIKQVFDGKVSEFLDLGSTMIIDEFKEELDEQFNNRLSDLEKEIMFCLAKNQKPISFYQLQQSLQLDSVSNLIEALNSLFWLSLIEKISTKEILFTLQPVIRKYVNKMVNR